MKVIEKFDFTANGIYRNRSIEVRKDDEGLIHFFEVNKPETSDFEKELDIDVIKWCVKNSKLPRTINPFIPLNEGESLEANEFYHYKGKSKKITNRKVIIISDNGSRCKIQDLDGNETSVAKSQLTLIEN
ncbi:MAG: hypothetical protein GF317_14875 [Candidatus Lokiarchaeota archaeon]|nr:hypothetical protein [Candidatus Lokiarchaeota archaeon]